ncbi:Fe2OG dioxygenase domain-containing protein [Balamuthia mandrillaris]
MRRSMQEEHRPLKRAKVEPNQGEEKENEKEQQQSTLARIAELIESLPESTKTSVGGAAPVLPPLPGLVVKGREISLPLSAADAAFLQSEGTVSPHGRGYDTVVDTSVRSSKEFDPAAFSFTNEQWDEAVYDLALTVAMRLGVEECNVEPCPYKLLLYSEGDHFLPHRDTEKEDGMFATLVIQLPSRCTGGALIVRHGGSSHKYDFGESTGKAAFQCHYAAHYADVEHEVEPVTSGHRLAVVYNLVWTNPNVLVPTSQAFQSNVQAFAEVLRGPWNTVPNGLVVMLLEHLYTYSGLRGRGIKALKGKDRVLASTIHAANALLEPQHRVSLFVITVDHTTHYEPRGYYGSWDSEDEEEEDDYDDDSGNWEVLETEEIIEWYSMVGKRVKFNDVKINWKKDVAAAKALSEKHVFSFKGDTFKEGYTGNAGPSKSTTYHRSALVMWPEATELQLKMTHGGLYSAAAYVRARSDKEEQLRMMDQVLDMWTNMPEKSDNRTSYSTDASIGEGATLLLKCLPSGDIVRLTRILDLIRTTKPTALVPSHTNVLSGLSKQIALSISDEQCASSEPLFQTVKNTAVPWIMNQQSGLEGASRILEVVVRTNPTLTRPLQLVDAFAQALQETEAKAASTSSSSPYSFMPTYDLSYKEQQKQESSLQRPLQVMAEKWAWKDIGPHVMALLHSSPCITLLHRLSMAKCLLDTAAEAGKAVAQDTLDDIMKKEDLTEFMKTKSSEKKLEAIHVPALVLCAAVDDLERGQKVCEMMVRDAGRRDTIRYLDDKSIFGAWPSFAEKMFFLLVVPRVQELEQAIGGGAPQFSWAQRPIPSKVPSGNRELLSFLLNPSQQSTVIAGFRRIDEARSFADACTRAKPGTEGFSAKATASGRSSTSKVTVEKTTDFFEHEASMYRQNCAELQALRARLAAASTSPAAEAKTEK